ncbi:MAG: DegT/DnrJ/EryC1/StrS family aminotransferase [Anaerolineae bacterium]
MVTTSSSGFPRIPISRPLIGEEEKAAVLEVLDSGQLAQGPRVREFEDRFAAWCGVEHAVATSSGTAALHIALLAHGIGPGDEVITPAFSFIASANCALFVGARPVFADIEPEYFTIDPSDIASRITPRTHAIIAVHLFGQPCDMDAIAEMAGEHNLVIIEDACQAHGARLHGRPVGSWGTACYSFYPTKNMTTGEGGMITANDAAIAERARLIRDHGSRQRYVHESLGYNLRMTDLQAAIGLVQLEKLEAWNAQRQANAANLTDRLAGVDGVVTPRIRAGATHVFHQYTIRVRDRDAAVSRLTHQGIGVGVYYPTPIHQQPLYRQLGYADSLTQVGAASREVLSLPVHPSLTAAELNCIVEAVACL